MEYAHLLPRRMVPWLLYAVLHAAILDGLRWHRQLAHSGRAGQPVRGARLASITTWKVRTDAPAVFTWLATERAAAPSEHLVGVTLDMLCAAGQHPTICVQSLCAGDRSVQPSRNATRSHQWTTGSGSAGVQWFRSRLLRVRAGRIGGRFQAPRRRGVRWLTYRTTNRAFSADKSQVFT